MRASLTPHILLCLLALLGLESTKADSFTTMVTQAAGEDWNGAIWDPGQIAPSAGNTYECLDNGTPFGNAQANTRIRNPAAAGLQTFVGDSLTLNTNTEIRAKAPGAILNFPGVGNNPGLILKGGVLNAGDDAVFVITGKVEVASTSFIVPGDNGGGNVMPLRGFNFAGQLSGKGALVIYQAGTNVAQEISGATNSFTGDFIVKSGWLKGSGLNSLGTGNITIDPLAAIEVDPSVTPAEGPALFEVGYEIVSPGKLTLLNGGMMILHQNCTFGAVSVEGTALSKGAHPYSELVASFPNNFAPGGSGSITVGLPPPHFTTTAVQAAGQNWTNAIWEPGLVAPVAGATYELLSNGTPFGNALTNTRVRNPAAAGVQTFPGDSLTLNANTEIRAKQAGAILNFPGVGGLPGLILNGGALNAGDDAVFTITGRVQVIATSYIVPADNGGGAVKPLRGFNLAGELSGSGSLVIYQAGTNVAQEISGTNNTFTGNILVKAGWLKGSGAGSLGTGNITIDPNAAVSTDASVTPVQGPAWLEVNYDINSPSRLTLQNGGMMILHQNCTFERVSIEGIPLDQGTHSYAELAAAFPASFAPGGSGSITARSGSAHFTTTVTEGAGTDWNGTIWQPGPVAPDPGDTFECLDNGTPFGAALNNTRIRNPAVAGLQTFVGDVLTLNTNTEIRAKGPGAILNFPGIAGKPGLILNGGNLNAGDDAVFVLTGRVQVASTSFIVPADNGAGAITPLRGFNIAGQLSGSGTLVIYQAGTQVAQEISGNQNTFTGDIILKAGWLKGSGNNSLGTGNILIDPLAIVEVDPSSTPAEGPAQFEVMYDIFTPGTLTIQNGGTMILHQDCTFSAVQIEGGSLSNGSHPFSELIALFPNSFAADGSGSITVRPPSAPPVPANVVVVNGDSQVSLTWASAQGATGYVVSRSATSGGPYTAVGSVILTNFVNQGLANGTTYYYVVKATNSFGVSANSAEVVGRPNVPVTGLTAVAGAGKVTLTWSALSTATSYSVKRALTSGGPYTNLVSGLTTTNYVDSAVQTGEQYYYAVVASLTNGAESGISTEAPALTGPAVPGLSTALFAATVITVKLTTPDPVLPQFILEQSTNGTAFSTLSTLPSGTAGFTNTDLQLNSTYYYRARAQNPTGTSDYSPVVRGTTPSFGININFANAVNGTPANNLAPTPPGYFQDVGEVFGDRGNGHNYGWDRDITTDGRWRMDAAAPDLRYDTFIHLEKLTPSAIWEIEIPNGSYQVHIVSGDSTATDSVFEHDVEGVVTDTYTPVTGAWWGEWTVDVTVIDGRLTLTTGPDGSNNKINFLDIYPPAAPAAPVLNQPSLAANNITISWSGTARLQEASEVNGVWTDVTGNPQGSYTTQATAPHKFYRLASP